MAKGLLRPGDGRARNRRDAPLVTPPMFLPVLCLSTLYLPDLMKAQLPQEGELDTYFKQQIAAKKSPSISVAVVKAGRVVRRAV